MARHAIPPMTFRTKLLLVSSFTLAGAVALVTGAVSVATRRAFEQIDSGRRAALLAQFEAEIKTQGLQVASAVDRAAESPQVTRIAAQASRHDPDFAGFYEDAQTVAETVGLPFLDVTRPDLTILSSAHWPVRFGYKNDWTECVSCNSSPFLTKIPLPDGTSALALAAVHDSHSITVIGARRLDAAFLKALGEAPGMRALLWLSPNHLFSSSGPVASSPALQSLADLAMTGKRASARIGEEAFLAAPLRTRDGVVGVLLAGSSVDVQEALERAILRVGLWVAAAGILFGVLLGWWTTERITRPVKELARGARQVASGDWSAKVNVASKDEMGALAAAFNAMTGQLIQQRDRALQAERVAAWRELASRLAHELKNPLFPLQLTVENMQRVRAEAPEQFAEVFQESAATLLEEVRNFKTIIARFSDFAKMPAPHFEPVDISETIVGALKLYEPQLTAAKIETRKHLPQTPIVVEADPDQLRRAFGNLTLNAIDAMKDGGVLTIRISLVDNAVRIETSDTGQGLTDEETARLFTPYYTTKQHGTGLGLAIVQGVVSDHHGRISVQSTVGGGATFVIELPLSQSVPGNAV